MTSISKRTRLAQMRRWRPSFIEIVSKTYRKYRPDIIANITRNNAFYRSLFARN